MFDVLYSFNLFPYTQLWRIGRQPQHNNKCSIIASLVILLTIGALFIYMLITVFQFQTITVSTQTLISQTPPRTTVTTYQSDTVNQPFMFAFDFTGPNSGFNQSNVPFNITAFSQQVTGGTFQNRTYFNNSFPLEYCTTDHFSSFSRIRQKFRLWKASEWLCLPLNKTWTLQGSWNLDGIYQSINILFQCSGNCSSLTEGVNIEFYTLSSIANPYNGSQPEQYFLEQNTVTLSQGIYQEYSYDLSENKINTDKSLFPWSSTQTTKSIKAESFKTGWKNYNQQNSTTLVYFQRSANTVVHDRNYYKLVDAASYVGGIFQAMIGLFVFISVFSRLFFEFTFAKKYFNSDVLKNFNFGKVLTQLVYKMLKGARIPPDWKQSEQRDELQKTVNDLLDMVYLHRRIDFLERTLPILFEEHQLKGLYLVHSKTKEEADQNYHNHRLRDRLISFLDQSNEEEKQRESIEKERIESQKHLRQIKLYPNSDPSMKEMMNQFADLRLRKKQTSNNMLTFGERSQDNQYFASQKEEEECFDNLRETAANIKDMNRQDIRQPQLIQWLQTDLIRLFREAEDPEGDKRSKVIYDSLDGWLKMVIRMVMRRKNKNFQLDEQLIRKRVIKPSQMI